MYGIIPATPPPDQSYDPTPRGVGLRGNGGVESFADQLARVNSRSSERSSHDEKARQEAENAPQRTADGDDEAGARVRASMDKSSQDESDRTTTHSDESDADKQQAARTDTAKSNSPPGEDAADLGDETDSTDVHSGVEAKLHEQKDTGQIGDRATKEANKLAVKAADAAGQDERANGAREARQEKSGKNLPKVPVEGSLGRERSAAAKGEPDSLKKPHHTGEEPAASAAESKAERKTEAAISQDAAVNAKGQNRADSATGKTAYAESLVERTGQSEDSERNRRVRTGQDPRAQRIAAEKAGTQTVEAKAVSPVDGENTRAEGAFTRELTVDLSEASVQSRDGGDGVESSLSAGRTEVALGESSSRPPSVSQATQTLARRLNGELGDSIVRQAKVMLQDANHAELRLIIRPPELGRIRIRLQMENGHIAGRILVDNGSVREVVEQNLASLQRAFEEAGLEMGDLEVSTGDARDDEKQGGQDQSGSGPRSKTAGVESFGRSIETISEYEPGRHRINLVA